MSWCVEQRTFPTVDRRRIVISTSGSRHTVPPRRTVETHRQIPIRMCCTPPLGNVVREVLSILDLEFSSRGNTQGTGRVPVSLENQPRMQRVDGTQMWREMSNNQEQMGSDQEAKRRWEKSGMSWMKKNSDQRPWDNDGNPGDEDSDSKRRWEKFLTHKHKMAIPWISMRNMSEFSLEDDIPMSRIWLQQTDSICYETDKNSTWYF